MAAAIRGRVHARTPIEAIEHMADGRVLVRPVKKEAEIFDAVIVATSPAAALRLLSEPTALEQRILGPWEFTTMRMCIHKDHSLLPSQQRLWGFWNPYTDSARGLCGATYVVGQLHTRLDQDVVVSWGPIQPIEPAKQIYARDVEISRYTPAALKTHKEFPRLNAQKHGIYYCGAHFGYGWHEAGVTSGLEVVARLQQDLAADSLLSRRSASS